MAERYDLVGEGNGSSGFMIGVLTGTVVGAALGILFAPKAGIETRSQLSDQAGKIADQASKGYRRAADTAAEWAETGRQKGREAYDRTREAVSRGSEEAERYVRETTSGPSAPMGTPMGTGNRS
jgi:gas vesicle protein